MMNKVILILLILFSAVSFGQSAHDESANEDRLKNLSRELRCLVCQNQTLAESNAPLAEDLRKEIRLLMAKEMSDQDIKSYLVARYGDFILYSPPFEMKTGVLWLAPGVMLILGLLMLLLAIRKRNLIINKSSDGA
jgi:cytochrome c-type biogenesis protein CcmH